MFDIEPTIERIEIVDFLAIRYALLEIGDVTTLIGPQAAGKSIIAKILFFGREYIRAFSRDVVDLEFDLRSFKRVQSENFTELFGGLIGYDDEFKIKYYLGEYELTVIRDKKGAKPRVVAGQYFEKFGRFLKKDFKKYLDSLKDTEQYSLPSFYYFRSSQERTQIQNSIPNTLFVPASRSFYSTVSQEIFTFLAADQRIGQLTAQFGQFFEFAKRRASGELTGDTKRAQMEARRINKLAEPVIGGEFQRQKSKDFIRTDWGRVPLPNASSGQQEALPLLLSLTHFPSSRRKNEMLIIEEPEAHLFPRAQKYILDQMMQVAEDRKCRMMFTTHSPYILACLNVHLARWLTKKSDSMLQVNVYYVADGKCHSIMDDAEGLIDTNFLDEISEVIASEFVEAIGD